MKYCFIPIGQNCSPALFLRGKNLRKNAYPFDWNITPLPSIIKLLSSELEIIDEKHMLYGYITKSNIVHENDRIETSTDVVTTFNKNLSIFFPHDFPNTITETKLKCKKKYNRRIERLKKLCNNSSIHKIFVFNSSISPKVKEHYEKCMGRLPEMILSPSLHTFESEMNKFFPNLRSSIVEITSVGNPENIIISGNLVNITDIHGIKTSILKSNIV